MRTAAAALLALAVVACQPGTNTHPVPRLAQIGSDLHCKSGDHGFEDSQAGWGFCYPGTWKYTERSQSSASPPGLDLTFDITDVQCAAASGPSARPSCAPNAGLFAFMIISTYERGESTSLASWVQANLTPPQPSPTAHTSPSPQTSPTPLTLAPIAWGNSTEAAVLADGRRIAMTPHHIVVLDIHSGRGLLDLDGEMGSRLGTWKFIY